MTAAVDAGVAAQGALELPVRMGIATSEAEQRDGDYSGPVLNRAARLMTAGHGGQMLVAESTAYRSGPGELGSAAFAGCAEPDHAVSAASAGPTRRLSTTTHARPESTELRPATTSFIGRESALSEIVAAVRARRLVTLTGMGGVGKTPAWRWK
jgi:hypothetical protein